MAKHKKVEEFQYSNVQMSSSWAVKNVVGQSRSLPHFTDPSEWQPHVSYMGPSTRGKNAGRDGYQEFRNTESPDPTIAT